MKFWQVRSGLPTVREDDVVEHQPLDRDRRAARVDDVHLHVGDEAVHVRLRHAELDLLGEHLEGRHRDRAVAAVVRLLRARGPGEGAAAGRILGRRRRGERRAQKSTPRRRNEARASHAGQYRCMGTATNPRSGRAHRPRRADAAGARRTLSSRCSTRASSSRPPSGSRSARASPSARCSSTSPTARRSTRPWRSSSTSVSRRTLEPIDLGPAARRAHRCLRGAARAPARGGDAGSPRGAAARAGVGGRVGLAPVHARRQKAREVERVFRAELDALEQPRRGVVQRRARGRVGVDLLGGAAGAPAAQRRALARGDAGSDRVATRRALTRSRRIACPALSKRTAAIPSARAASQLSSRSSTNTQSLRRHAAEPLERELVDRRVGLAHARRTPSPRRPRRSRRSRAASPARAAPTRARCS